MTGDGSLGTVLSDESLEGELLDVFIGTSDSTKLIALQTSCSFKCVK